MLDPEGRDKTLIDSSAIADTTLSPFAFGSGSEASNSFALTSPTASASIRTGGPLEDTDDAGRSNGPSPGSETTGAY
jgi:hypothetical protein